MSFQVPVGLGKKKVNVVVCAAGLTKIQAHAAKVQYRKAEGCVSHGNPWYDLRGDVTVQRVPYIFARYLDPATGRTARPELGKFLLGSSIPVAHFNGDPLDFRIENLEPRQTEKQIKRAAIAAAKREERDKKKAARSAKLALKPPKERDGLTPDEQFSVLFDVKFQSSLTRMAGAIVRDPFQRGTPMKPTDEKRGEEIVSAVTESALQPIRNGQVKDVRSYAYTAVRTQARKERGRKWAKLGHIRRPKAEPITMSDYEDRQGLTK